MSGVLGASRPELPLQSVSLLVFGGLAALLVVARPWTTVTSGPLVVGLTPGLFVVAALLGRPVGLLGATGGYLVGQGSLAPFVLCEALGLLVLGVGSGVLRDAGAGHSGDGRTLLTVVGAAVGAGSVTAWGTTLLGWGQYFPMVLTVSAGYLLSALAGTGVVLVVERTGWDWGDRRWLPSRARASHAGRLVEPLGIVAGWVVLGSLVSVGTQSLQVVPVELFHLHGVSAVAPVAELARTSSIVVGLHAALGVACATLVVRWGWREWEVSPREQ